ncbi:hypothetical protein [uncultured Nocardioides sp.]|uniref:hypothetical protein n=1 Tax=uncultured Nocardioides sp. TaxID=198441 RepID=UPI000C4DF446|nr:hypothetical protein [Nocardioides sp.]|tara:strand:+ start:4073 stop:4897 length:825 start_codon:yes stop_codon:yes gene_type:complete
MSTQDDAAARRTINAAQLQRLRGMYGDLDRWRERSREHEEPESGSDMARDTGATPGLGMPFHVLARHQLASGTQHLNMARTCIEAREYFPLAHPTALRGALLGSSRGVWLLSPSDASTRQVRGARVALDMHRRLGEWVDEPYSGVEQDSRDQAQELMRERIADLEARDGVKEEPHWDTSVIRQAGQFVFSDPRQQGEVMALWRQLSGDAHSLVWPHMTRAGTVRKRVARDPRYPAPMHELTTGTDLREFVNEFSAAFRILKVGWSLFDQRCTAE